MSYTGVDTRPVDRHLTTSGAWFHNFTHMRLYPALMAVHKCRSSGPAFFPSTFLRNGTHKSNQGHFSCDAQFCPYRFWYTYQSKAPRSCFASPPHMHCFSHVCTYVCMYVCMYMYVIHICVRLRFPCKSFPGVSMRRSASYLSLMHAYTKYCAHLAAPASQPRCRFVLSGASHRSRLARLGG